MSRKRRLTTEEIENQKQIDALRRNISDFRVRSVTKNLYAF